VFVEGTWPGVFDLAASRGNTTAFSFEGPELKFHVIPGPRSGGDSRPLRAGGPRRSLPPNGHSCVAVRDEHVNPRASTTARVLRAVHSQVVEDVLMLQALDIPLGVYWIDRPWAVGHEGYDDFTCDRGRVPTRSG